MGDPENTPIEAKPHPLREIVRPFVDAARAPRVLWGNNLQYLLEGFLYWGFLNYLVIYGVENIGLNELHAGWVVTLLAMGITFSQFLLGGLVDRWGARRGLLIALTVLLLGRIILSSAGSLGLSTAGTFSPALLTLLTGVVIVLLGYGLYEPAAYTLVRQVTTPKTAAMGYAMLYALMNLGGALLMFLGPARRAIGINGLYWVFTALTLFTLLITAAILTRKTMSDAIASAKLARGDAPVEPDDVEKPDQPTGPPLSLPKKVLRYLREHPMADLRFSFFIFVLMPVQTLFAHNYLTMPLYVKRGYEGTWLGDNFEVAVNINPFLIFLLVPIVAALTYKTNIYRLMVVGTAIMAAPTFLLAFGPSVPMLGAYLLIMSFGEAIWQPRFLQYAAEIAPEGKTGAYLGVARLPWFMTKMITGLYAGWFLMRYCPDDGVLDTGTMWFWHGVVAIITPILLILATRWMKKSFST
ncbi:MAG: MFS transporter [Acidobacteria bacterium]|uniref:MFS transporter n=1 Tax=Candidatus Polarisedimenticola svalbardensis TaxID=2886004 RepID=A0A8J6Y245_9BACT|nr:MFS transporter [Candidatus Polarisedimenticola svalbardensis]